MRKLLFTTALLMILAGISWAVPTTVTVRAKSKDAKFIGSHMGGALVVIRDAETGEVLAQGLTRGRHWRYAEDHGRSGQTGNADF